MPKRKRPAKIPTPVWADRARARGRQQREQRSQIYVLAGFIVVIALVVGIVVFAFARERIEEAGRPGSTALVVGGTKFNLEYFARRLRQQGQQADPTAAITTVVDAIVREEIVRQFAEEEGVTVSPAEIDSQMAEGLGTTVENEAVFRSLLQQELARTGFTESEYRQLVEANILTKKIQDKLREALPDKAESVHYAQILVATDAEAEEIMQLLADGEDFAALAKERSLDPATRTQGGDMGWVPKGALIPALEEAIFALDEGDLEIVPTQTGTLVVQVLEKAKEREIEDAQREAMVNRAFQDWLDEKRQAIEITDAVTADPDKLEWAVSQAYGG